MDEESFKIIYIFYINVLHNLLLLTCGCNSKKNTAQRYNSTQLSLKKDKDASHWKKRIYEFEIFTNSIEIGIQVTF